MRPSFHPFLVGRGMFFDSPFNGYASFLLLFPIHTELLKFHVDLVFHFYLTEFSTLFLWFLYLTSFAQRDSPFQPNGTTVGEYLEDL